jgi:hypothetical protein
MIDGINHKSKLTIDQIPMLRPFCRIATDSPNNKNIIYLNEPQRMQLGIIRLNV